MAVQQPIASFNRRLVGRTLDVLIDARAGAKDLWLGRTYADAPDVDGLTWFRAPLQPGDLVACEIVDAEGYDLVARPVSPPRRRDGGGPAQAAEEAVGLLAILDGMP